MVSFFGCRFSVFRFSIFNRKGFASQSFCAKFSKMLCVLCEKSLCPLWFKKTLLELYLKMPDALIVALVSVFFFWLLKEKLRLTTSKAFIRFGLLGLLLLLAYCGNAYYFWEYFKQYTGPLTISVFVAHWIAEVVGYGLLAVITMVVCSMVTIVLRKLNS